MRGRAGSWRGDSFAGENARRVSCWQEDRPGVRFRGSRG
jgi:hypothetical protein